MVFSRFFQVKLLICILKGIATHVPSLYKLSQISKGTGGTVSARYCYAVWLRHLVMAYKNGPGFIPEVIAELGPGDSFGIGLAALLSGANKYYAFDVIKYAKNKRNIEIFDELTDLFRKREKIPGESEFPQVKPYLRSYEFPSHILNDEHLGKALKKERIESIKRALINLGFKETDGNIQIHYFVPWHDPKIIKEESVDMLYSQAVLEHVKELSHTYAAMYRWLKPDGLISHEIDFKCHGKAVEWNGHWTYTDFIWSLIRGKRSYLINRQPHSMHINLMKKAGFKLLYDKKSKDTSGITGKYLAPRFSNISDDDLTTCDAFIQAIKK